jgi:hypothetical protein
MVVDKISITSPSKIIHPVKDTMLLKPAAKPTHDSLADREGPI